MHRRVGAHLARTFTRPAFAIVFTIAVLAAILLTLVVPRQHTQAAVPRIHVATTNVTGNEADFKPDVIYQVMLDRFFDGNPNNNNPSGDTGLYDSTKQNWKLYWGGDLQGLTDKISYLAGMGITALWISPPVDNIHTAAVYNGVPNAGYHGYWARDDYRIDPHLGTWSDFDTLVSTAHSNGIKIVIDFAPNHSNPNDTGEYGSIYNNGVFQAAYNNDPNGWFHHNGGIQDYNNIYQDEYYNLADLADLAQENSSVDSYLKGAINQFLTHGVDGVRVDAVKHMPDQTGGWDRTLSDDVESQSSGPHYMVGEWYLSSISDPTYGDAVRFANNSGINLLNFPLTTALRDVYGSGNGASELDSVVSQEESNFTWLNDQGNFIDNHDMSRFLTLNSSYDRMQEAEAASMTLPGIPIIYYGTEQYLHNDTSGGGDPYNRPMMSSFSTTTTAYQEIADLSALRHSNPALAYGTYEQRWINSDVFIYERQFFNNVVLVAVNKGSSGYNITGLNTNLPNGNYSDYLGSLLHGGATLSVSGGAASAFTLGANQVSVWQYTAPEASAPEIGSIGPNLSHPGDTVIIDGQGFGGTTGTVKFGTTAATVKSWSSHSITVTTPSIAGGQYSVTVCTGTCSNGFLNTVSSAAQIPVTFTVYNAPPTNVGDNVYLTGSVSELGNWSTASNIAIGPMDDPNYPNWFIMASVPACWQIQFKFIIIRANGTVQWENGSNHSYTVPCSGVGYTNVTWQN
jgi:glycosidase